MAPDIAQGQAARIAGTLVVQLVEQAAEMGIPVEYSASGHERVLRIAVGTAVTTLVGAVRM